jgi:gas vesicle protein
MAKFGAFLSGIACGGVAGLAFGILSAPKRGSEMRHDLVEASDSIYRKASYELAEIAERLEDLRTRIEEKQALTKAVEDFTPRVDAAVGRAQSALEQTQHTTAESKEMLSRAKTMQDYKSYSP